nr:MAG TPA: metal transport protein [Caudoviricetes sp.]
MRAWYCGYCVHYRPAVNRPPFPNHTGDKDFSTTR